MGLNMFSSQTQEENKKKKINKNNQKKSLLLMFLRSLPLCVNLMCALSKPAFSLNLHASICCLVAGLQRHHGEHKFNLR